MQESDPPPTPLCSPKFRACMQSVWKVPVSDMAAPGSVPPMEVSPTAYSDTSPQQATKNSPGEKCYYKEEWLLCDSHCFIKKIFFFPKQIFGRRIQRFSKATAKTEQLIILFLKGLLLHRRFLYPSLRFTSLSCCTWPLGRGEVGNG